MWCAGAWHERQPRRAATPHCQGAVPAQRLRKCHQALHERVRMPAPAHLRILWLFRAYTGVLYSLAASRLRITANNLSFAAQLCTCYCAGTFCVPAAKVQTRCWIVMLGRASCSCAVSSAALRALSRPSRPVSTLHHKPPQRMQLVVRMLCLYACTASLQERERVNRAYIPHVRVVGVLHICKLAAREGR